jgi:hypothetical protein
VVVDQAASEMRISTCKPAAPIILTRVSRPVGVYARFNLNWLRPSHFRAAHPTIGLRIMEPAGLPELVGGKVNVLINRGNGHHPGYRCEQLEKGSGTGDYLICPEGTASCPEIEILRAWLNNTDVAGRVVRFPRAAARGSS